MLRQVCHSILTTNNSYRSDQQVHKWDKTKQIRVVDLLKEVEYFICCDSLVFMSIDSAEGCIWFELYELAKNLALALNFKLTLRHLLEEISQIILCV